ncbi:MAG: cytochrome c [Moorea sp. SIO1F2]|uniref:Cytochrome C n=1 Tax=Moorena bouillonii PNG TaxID=568701 RepID=A0A1U7N7W8_9CYAN|nr:MULTISPECIES: cytochrome c [Moorena]NEN97936.1 cytochrome c [Moorena sp. SIO3I7]NEO15927.1 cytochrome c [Moorena sp. SIO3E8]NEO60609.1 cytochrome c [Moorena sp. SIO4G2]NEP21598.1 cytochrome c [Moorena sp. SIO3I6]NEQ02477.1 cytochrome c [Moorena sp. SIO3F7]
MENQLVQPRVLVRRVTLIVLVALLAISLSLIGIPMMQDSDPYVQKVLSLNGDPVRGNAIFQINCAGCHGANGDGNVGPSLLNISKRKSDVSLIQQVISGRTPPMPKFQPQTGDMADLLSYLEQL